MIKFRSTNRASKPGNMHINEFEFVLEEMITYIFLNEQIIIAHLRMILKYPTEKYRFHALNLIYFDKISSISVLADY